MAIPKIVGAQRDFSAGEIDVALKRADEHPARQKGVRQLANWRILNSGAVQNRPGRRALFLSPNANTRTEEFTLSSGNTFKIAFGNNNLVVLNSAGAGVAATAKQGNGVALPWTTATVGSIVYAILGLSIYITFPGMRPQVLTWDGATTWTIADYAELVGNSSQKRTPFYRLSPKNVTMLPSATTGAITVSFSAPIAVAGMTGTRVRYAGRQILLGSVISNQQMNATVLEPLPASQILTVTGSVGVFTIGDTVNGDTSGAEGIVIASPNQQNVQVNLPIGGSFGGNIGDAVSGATSGATGVIVSLTSNGFVPIIQLSTATPFVGGETLNGPSYSRTIISVSGTSLLVQPIVTSSNITRYFAASEGIAGPAAHATISTVTNSLPQAISVWDEEVMNSYRGYPASVFVDQFRLGFCNFPALPNAIAWSAINSPTDLYVDGQPSNAIFELAPEKVQVYFVVPGPESSEFIFTDRKVYYIPISASNPLKPGSVSFQILSDDGASQVQPRAAGELIFYAGSGGNSIKAVIATGAYLRPFNTKNVTEFASHLFASIAAIAAPTSDSSFTERYVYALNASGAVVSGKYSLGSIERGEIMGWGPWSGGGAVSWVGAWAADVLFTTSYFGVPVCELLDDAQYLDCAFPVNAPPATFTPAPGQGPLWWIAGKSVTLMDQTMRPMGTYQIDGNGFLIPQDAGGENLAAASLVAGQPWTATIEPFVPDANPGNSVHQRMFKRRVSRMAVYVSNSTGFLLARLFSGPLTRTSPALGTIMNFFRVTAYNQDDDATLPPFLREEAQRWRPIGRSYDARVALIKDTPGPLVVHEFGLEASI